MKNKYFYPIYKLKIKSWIKYWLIKQTEFKGVLSDILEGISFYLTDSLNMKFKMFDIIGRTTQESTSGKNKLNIADGNTLTTKSFDITDYIEVDKAYSFSAYLDLKNTTTTAQARIRIDKYVGTKPTYLGGNIIANKGSGISKRENVTFDSSVTQVLLTIQSYGTSDFNCDYSQVMGEEGSTATAYEPYTGGEPAPNPNYPFPIKNTGDNGSVNEKVSNSDGTQEQNLSFPLAQGQKFYEGSYPDDDEKVHHKMGEIDLSTLTYTQYATNKYRSNIINNIKIPATQSTIPNMFAEKYRPRMQNGTFENGEIGITQNGEIILCDTTGTPSGIIQYELAEETKQDFTEKQKTAWEEWKKARTYKNVTHISSEDETPALLKIQYWKEG